MRRCWHATITTCIIHQQLVKSNQSGYYYALSSNSAAIARTYGGHCLACAAGEWVPARADRDVRPYGEPKDKVCGRMEKEHNLGVDRIIGRNSWTFLLTK